MVKDKLKLVGDILGYYTDKKISNETCFGDIRKKVFTLLAEDDVHLLGRHFNNNDYDESFYKWQYINDKSNKITTILRSIFTAVELEFDSLKKDLCKQYESARSELINQKSVKTINKGLLTKSDQVYLESTPDLNKEVCFEYHLYRKAERLFYHNMLTAKESITNRSLDSDLIPKKEWSENKVEIIEKTGLHKLKIPIKETLNNKQDQLKNKILEVSQRIFSGNSQ